MPIVSSLSLLRASGVRIRAARRRWRSAARLAGLGFAGRDHRFLPAAVFMTDPARIDCPWRVVRFLPRGWAVIYRHFGSPDRYHTAMRLIAEARRRHIRVLIAADPDLARRTGADGVHWPERLLPSRVGRLRPHWIITAAAHDASAIARARTSRADAVIVSPVLASPYDVSSLRVWRFRSLVRAAMIPCYGLGGITHASAARIVSVARVAAVSGVIGAFAPRPDEQS